MPPFASNPCNLYSIRPSNLIVSLSNVAEKTNGDEQDHFAMKREVHVIHSRAIRYENRFVAATKEDAFTGGHT